MSGMTGNCAGVSVEHEPRTVLCRQQLDELTQQHEGYARQLRDRLLREQDLAVEKERQAAQDRLREAAERLVFGFAGPWPY